jgi:nucleoside-diphosphate-sugar epimerase
MFVLNIFLTGAQGFTGRHFSAAAKAAGHQVTPLTANLLDVAALIAEISAGPPDAVVHLAGISFVGHSVDRAFYDVNLFGTLNLLEALNHTGRSLACVLLASSANVYGNCKDSPITESQPAAPVNHYAMSKLAMEHMARAHASQLPLVFARPFNYTGPGQPSSFVVPKMVNHVLRRASRIELGNMDVEREFNDVRTVCDAYLRLLQQGKAGETYNICTGVTYSLSHVLDALTRLTGHAMESQVNPAFLRPNEINKLCGSPQKLEATVGKLKIRELDDTLSWMLSESTPV